MKRTLVVLMSGLLAGVVAHSGWYHSRRPCDVSELTCQLAWIRTELKLTDAQYAHIVALHQASSPKLTALANQVAQMRDEYQAFERERVTEGNVDFVEFARFVEQRREIDRQCLALTRQLVSETSQTMNPDQRERYFGLLGPVFHDVGASVPH